jgi:hypothetical protein
MNPVKNMSSATAIATASGVPSTGQLIGDRYRLDRPLERGAMGSVWRAEQVRLRAPVAVKFLDPSLIGDKEMHDRFMQEARSAAAVRSAHVVQVFDYGSEGGVPYIAMELLDGENLDARLSSRGTLTAGEVDKLFNELARGISQAHAIGVIHRDLKPGNIFIAREGEHEVTKIVDFGIAKVKASALRLTQGVGTQLGTLLGTPQYMSPEQVRGSGSIDHRTDLWALAVIACECLTGRCPFSGATIGDLTVQICTEKPPAPSSLGPVPPGFDQWFFKATQKKANKRFQSVEEMAERLHAVLAPAMLAAPGAARAGRLITLPSRSEVRLAYSAVVTWKGYLLSHLGQRWVELQQLTRELIALLAARFAKVRGDVRRFAESDRLAFMRPLLERHGVLASVALLCCGILMLGLTSRGSDTAGNTRTASQIASAARALEAAPLGEARAAEVPSEPSRNDPTSVSVAASPVALGDEVPRVAAAAPTDTADTDGARPLGASPSDVSPSGVTPGVVAAEAARAPEVARAEAAPRVTSQPAAAPVRRAPEPQPEEAADPKKGKPITRAMAQAAAKILTADELIASAPVARKPAPRAPAPPQQRATQKRAPGTTTKGTANHPFDSRL